MELERDSRLFAQKVDEMRSSLHKAEGERAQLELRVLALTSELASVKSQRDDALKRLAESQTAREALEQERLELRTQNERLADVLKREAAQRVPSRGDIVAGEGSFFLTQAEDNFVGLDAKTDGEKDTKTPLQAVLTGQGVVGGRSYLMDGTGELNFGEIAVGTTAKVVIAMENSSPTPTVYEVTISLLV